MGKWWTLLDGASTVVISRSFGGESLTFSTGYSKDYRHWQNIANGQFKQINHQEYFFLWMINTTSGYSYPPDWFSLKIELKSVTSVYIVTDHHWNADKVCMCDLTDILYVVKCLTIYNESYSWVYSDVIDVCGFVILLLRIWIECRRSSQTLFMFCFCSAARDPFKIAWWYRLVNMKQFWVKIKII